MNQRPAPTRVIEPGTLTAPRTDPGPAGNLDLRTVPLDPAPVAARHFAVTAVGQRLGSEFDGVEIGVLHLSLAAPGTVLITIVTANPAGERRGLISAEVHLVRLRGNRPEPVAVWPALDHTWPETVRTSVLFAARHPRSNR